MEPVADPCLAATDVVDADHPEVVAFARARAGGARDARAAAVRLYYAVRDGIRYDPYRLELTREGQRASRTLAVGYGWCVSKAILLAAGCRALGIPARLGFADVRNHLSTARMRERMQTDVFYWHGYSAIHLGGRWVKATPAFNIELTRKFGLLPLEFDGREDSIYHPFDAEGKRHMEYLRMRGEYPDLPLDEMLADFARLYPYMFGGEAAPGAGRDPGDFERDVALETGGPAGESAAASSVGPVK